MKRPDASAERMVPVTKRYGLSVVLALPALLVTLLIRPETLVGPVFLLATLAIDNFFLPPRYTLRFNPAELPELLAFFVSADLSHFAVITDMTSMRCKPCGWSALISRNRSPSRSISSTGPI